MLPTLSCSPEADPCCPEWYTALKAVADQVAARLDACVATECSDTLEGFVAVSSDLLRLDAVTVIVDRIETRAGSQSGAGQATLNELVFVGRVRLLETGWPMVDDTGPELTLPSSQEWVLAVTHALSHGQKLQRVLHQMRTDGTFNGCRFSRIGNMLPLRPESGTFGWDVQVELVVR